MQSFVRYILRWMMSTKIWAWLLKQIIRKVRFSWNYTSMTGVVYRKAKRVCQPGDLILTVDSARLSAITTPGKWAHGAICVGVKNGTVKIAEMTGDGFGVVDLFDVCSHADHIAVWRCQDWDEKYVQEVIIPNCSALIDTPYDSEFKPGSDKIYCFELWQTVDQEQRLKLVLDEALGRSLVTGTSVTEANNAYCVFDSHDTIP
jgi:hypothetical protein